MPRAHANGIEIEYEPFGDPSRPAILLIMGFGAQMVHWRSDFCQDLAERGFHVVRFDNRDVGLSSKMDDLGRVDVSDVLAAQARGQRPEVPYTIDAMAEDTVGLMDALELERAHLCGASMGGMIAQTVAIRHPDRVRTLTSIMSTTGAPGLPTASPEVMAALLQPVPQEREAALAHSVEVWRTIGSPGFEFDEDDVRRTAAEALDRCVHPAGVARQFGAIAAHGSRRSALENLSTPTLVIHGKEDPLVPWECGKDTADAIPGATLMTIKGMGHDLPRAAWPQILCAIEQLALQVDGPRDD